MEEPKKSGSKQKSATSSRASHSKVFKKIEIKSANLVSQSQVSLPKKKNNGNSPLKVKN